MTALDDPPAVAGPGRTDDVLLAEKAVLASMIASRAAAEELLDLLPAEDCFGDGTHRAVYAAVRWYTEEGSAAERGTLNPGDRDGGGSVQRRFSAVLGRLAAVERGAWQTSQAAVILGSLAHYVTPGYRQDAALVLRAAVQRRTVSALDTALNAAAKPGFDAAADGDLIRKLLDEALGGVLADPGAETAAALFDRALERMEAGRPVGVIQFPWEALRQIVPFLRPGQLASVLARPSVGKSLVGDELARYTGVRRRIPCVLFTMEMDPDEVIDRLIAAEAGVLHERIVNCDLDDEAWNRLGRARERFAESKLIVDGTPRITVPHIRARLRGMARHEPAQLVIVDYLQLMKAGQGENRQQEVAALVGGLKAVAREFRIPVVMLCQLNRGPENRQDRQPRVSDARESGSVENDSDVAILIHREDFYDPESPRAGEADLIVDKNRNGRRGTAVVAFHPHYARITDLPWSSSRHAEDAP